MDEQRLSQSTSHSAARQSGGPHFDPRNMPAEPTVVSHEVHTGYFWKRPADFMLSGLALVALAPLFLVISLLIKLTSPGPVFFRQQRLGLNERPFSIFKFRSMRAGSDKSGAQFTSANDARVTGIGKLIRKTSLDELPELWNVLRGDMSLVGPRPLLMAYLPLYTPEQARRHALKPGITGWAQVNGLRGETDTQEKIEARVEHDVYYAENWSLAFDIRILIMTVLLVHVFMCRRRWMLTIILATQIKLIFCSIINRC